ncbi:protein of unknown function [Agromyces sp. CF514]|nr:protein of unknown function [Agromyces sp. CF514]
MAADRTDDPESSPMDAPTPQPVPNAPAYGAPSYGAPSYGPPSYGTTDVAAGHGSPVSWVPPVTAPQNVLAWVALGLGLGSMMFGLLASVAAIICGHIARRQIRERGDQGGAAALIGLIFGYVMTGLIVAGLALYFGFIALMLGAAATSGEISNL